MRALLHRLLDRWLHAIAPPGWADAVLGDLIEEGTGAQLLQKLQIIIRLTLDAITAWASRSRARPLAAGGPMFITELRHATRSLRRSPGFTFTTVITLAIAIGANTAIYSALRSLVLQPLPFPDSDRLVFVWLMNPSVSAVWFTPSRDAIARFRSLTHVFESVESFDTRSTVVLEGGEPDEFEVSHIDPGILNTLRVAPTLGRPLVESDTSADAPKVVLISHQLWQQRFGSNRELGALTMSVNGTPHTIVGVMPPKFRLPMGSDALWVPARDSRPGVDSENTIARLRPEVTIDDARRALAALGPVGGEGDLKVATAHLMTPGDYNGTQIRRALLVLTGAAGFLLLIACVNVANLLLTRNAARSREIAVRLAVGISRRRLMRHVLAEAILLAAAGATAGLLVARGCVQVMLAMRPANLEVLDRVAVDTPALAFLATISILTTLIVGAAPALTAARTDLLAVLRSGSGQSTASNLRARRLLAIAQTALALMLAIGASLLLRSYARLTAVDPGFQPSGVLSARVSLPSNRYPVKDAARRRAFFDQVFARIAEHEQVTSVALASGVPPRLGILFGTLEIEGRPADKRSTLLSGGHVSAEFFSTLQIPILEGRPFLPSDGPATERVAVVGRSFAESHWKNGGALGAKIRIDESTGWVTVVGVAGAVKNESATRPQIYFARSQTNQGFATVIVRTNGDPTSLIPVVKAAIWDVDPALPIRDVATLDQLLWESTSQSRFNMVLLGSLAACGLVLAVVGVYGVMSLFVGERERELGIRIALGASRESVTMLVVRQSASVLFVGVLAGLLGAAWLTTFLETMLYETTPGDPVSFATAGLAMLAAAAAAVLGPILRASRVNPTTLLRAE
jgi:putative ABC transport system permease protein